MGKIAIEFKRVSKRYPNAAESAVKEVSVKIPEGRFITILGTSGSGKTTFIKMVNRIYEPTSGEILFFGENIKNLKIEEYRRKIGYVIQQVGLFPHMKIADNIATVPKLLKWDKTRINARINELLELVGLPPKEYKNRYPRQLSGGQQQRVGLARAMAADPEIMLMDEPFGAIDAVTRRILQDELLQLQKKLHKTILFVTHDVGEAFKLGDQVIIMHEGEIQQFDTPCNIILNPINEYVAQLASTQDALQQLKAVSAREVMRPFNVTDVFAAVESDARRVRCETPLYEILTHLLATSTNSVWVEDDAHSIIGIIQLKDLKLKNKQQRNASA